MEKWKSFCPSMKIIARFSSGSVQELVTSAISREGLVQILDASPAGAWVLRLSLRSPAT